MKWFGGFSALALTVLACSNAASGAEQYAASFHESYGDVQSLTIHGRVLVSRSQQNYAADDGKLQNFKNSAKTLRNPAAEDYSTNIVLGAFNWPIKTDGEGYFSCSRSTPPSLKPGWHPLSVTGAGAGEHARLLIVPTENTLGIISDIDDTVVESEVLDKTKLLKNTYLKNPAQRKAVPGVAAFYKTLAQRNTQPDLAPIFYLSASPSQLQERIRAFLDLNHFPDGVLVTKKLNRDKSADPWLDQVRYKTVQIENILLRLPHVRFVLVGDDGEKDPEIYNDIATRFPNRVDSVYIRKVNPDQARPSYPEQRALPH